MLIKLTETEHTHTHTHTQILKAASEKQQIKYKWIPIRITADLSTETLKARKEWQCIVTGKKGGNLKPRLLYPARISFRLKGEIKSFTDRQELIGSTSTKPGLQETLKDLL